jgi:hypothetical protein
MSLKAVHDGDTTGSDVFAKLGDILGARILIGCGEHPA